MKKILPALFALTAGCQWFFCEPEPIASAISPDGRNEIRLYADPLSYVVARDGVVTVERSRIGLRVGGRDLTEAATLRKVRSRVLKGSVATPIYKKSLVRLDGRETVADFGDWAVRLVARDDGVAYRFETKFKGRIRIDGEIADVAVPSVANCQVNFTERFGCEETVAQAMEVRKIQTDGKQMIYLPFVYETAGKTVAVTESDVFDYPVWNLTRDPSDNGVKLAARFAGWPLESGHCEGECKTLLPFGGRWVKVFKHANYLVETAGTRKFPWRTFLLVDEPSKLCEADIVYALARPAAKKADFSWVRPGKVAWDWWNNWNLQGVNFKAGCNTKSYEYYIDFAAKHGIEYVILDEGWSEKLDIWKYHPDVDVPHLIDYARRRGVGIILWMAWAQAVGEEEKVAKHFAKLGVKGFKVDFMDRGDAEAERFLWKFARVCAKHKLLVDYHGAHRPTGLQRAFPNVVNYEAVHGLEQTKWFLGEYDFSADEVRIAFLRMSAGPLDFTPGAMDNYSAADFPKPKFPQAIWTDDIYRNPGSVGTRSRQLAMMALYEAPLQMLCDTPTKYEKNAECLKFMVATPVVWAETRGLGGTPDTCVALARKAYDGAWYVAAISDASARDIVIDTSFLEAGDWQAEVFRDVPDSGKATAYVHETVTVKAGESLKIKMAPGGGWVARFSK